MTVPYASERARETAALVERARGPAPERPCHNDLLAANFIGRRAPDPDRRLGVRGDGRCLLRSGELLTSGETAAFVRAYFGDIHPEHERALTLMRFMSDFREAMWGVAQQAISDLDFDFAGYADEHSERLAQIASERAFREALAG